MKLMKKANSAKPKKKKKQGLLDYLLGPDPRYYETDSEEDATYFEEEEEESTNNPPNQSVNPNPDTLGEQAIAESLFREVAQRDAETKSTPVVTNPKREKKKPEPKPKEPAIHPSQLKSMKRKYFIAVFLLYIGIFFGMYGITSIFLIIVPHHPYINLIAVILILAFSVALTAYIANVRFQSSWLRKSD